MSEKRLYMLDLTYSSADGDIPTYSAMSKPRTDTMQTLTDLGAEIKMIPIYQMNKSRLLNALRYRLNVLSVYFRFLGLAGRIKNSVVFMQYPFSPIGHAYRIPIWAFKRNGNKVVVQVHDLDTLRHKSKVFESLDRLFTSGSDACIIHSLAMKEKLKKLGWTGNYYVQEFFDYRSSLDLKPKINLRDARVIFAGNLEKSLFLRHLAKMCPEGNVRFHLYGSQTDSVPTNDFVRYMGRFSPDCFGDIDGDWGLVWDGDRLDGCGGNMGDYLRVNAPFKFSLYLAAKRPVIVWSQSAMSEYVRKYHIGICVDRIEEIPNAINRLTDEELAEIMVNVEKVSAEVRGGKKLESVLLEAFQN